MYCGRPVFVLSCALRLLTPLCWCVCVCFPRVLRLPAPSSDAVLLLAWLQRSIRKGRTWRHRFQYEYQTQLHMSIPISYRGIDRHYIKFGSSPSCGCISISLLVAKAVFLSETGPMQTMSVVWAYDAELVSEHDCHREVRACWTCRPTFMFEMLARVRQEIKALDAGSTFLKNFGWQTWWTQSIAD